MTDRKEIITLIECMRSHGANVDIHLDEEGRMSMIRITGVKYFGEYHMTLLSAAERMREWLHAQAAA